MVATTLSDAIKKELINCFEEFQIVVWYDRGGTLDSIVEQCVPKTVELLRYSGSYIRIRVEVEQDFNLSKKRLIYIPKSPLEPSWLRDYEMIGKTFIMDLRKALWDILHLERTHENELFLTPLNCRRLSKTWASIMGEVDTPLSNTDLERGLIAAVLGFESRFDIEEIVLQLLSYPEQIKNRIQNANLESTFSRALLSYGLPVNGLEEPAILAAAILFSDLSKNSTNANISDLEVLLPDESNQTKWARFVKKWSETVSHRESFSRWNKEIENKYSVLERVRGNDSIVCVESFHATDVALLEIVKSRVETNYYEELLAQSDYIVRIATERKKRFWSREDVVKEWDVLLNAIKILELIDINRPKLDEGLNGSGLVQLYFDELWRIDDAYCTFASSTRELSDTFIINIQEIVDSQYQRWLTTSNETFTSLVSKTQKWPVEGVNFQQDFWQQTIQNKTRTCLFLIDALRFDLQKRLMTELERRDHQVELHRSLSSLPTITEVCMSTILPHTSDFALIIEGNSILIGTEEDRIAVKKDREKYIEKAWKGTAKFTNIDNLIRSSDKDIVDLRNKDLLVVWSIEIDSLGNDLSTEVLDTFDQILQRVVSAVERAAVLGYSRIVITTDHGFLLIPSPDKVDVLDSLLEADVIQGRRFAVGIPPSTENALVIPLTNIGYNSAGEVLLPYGIRFLSQPGPKKLFVHGGLSLQECCIGSLIIEPAQLANRVDVKMIMVKTIAAGVFKVEIKPLASTLQPLSRRVRIEIIADGQILEKLGPFELLSDNIIEMIKTPAKYKQVVVRAVDVDTLETLDEKSVRINLEGYDDLL